MADSLLEALRQAVIEGDDEVAAETAGAVLASGTSPDVVLTVISEAGDELGKMFEAGDCFLPELFAGAEAMNAVVEKVTPALGEAATQPRGSVVIGTVEGDVHEIGKRIVCAMLSGAGYRVHDLGIDVTAAQFVAKVRELHPDIVAASAYITTTCQRLPAVGAALREAGLRDQVAYVIGGASVNPGMVAWAGADGFGENAAQAVAVVRALMEKGKGGRE